METFFVGQGGLDRGHARIVRVLVLVFAFVLPASPSVAREFDESRPWFVEGSVGTVQPGPGTDLGAGQDYGLRAGIHVLPRSDLSLAVSWSHARNRRQAIETDLTAGTLAVRAWAGSDRWSPYAETGLGVQSLDAEQRSVLSPVSDRSLRFGAEVGLGVLYSRSTWWGGLGAELHGSWGRPVLDEGHLVTFTTYRVFVGQSLGW